MAEFIYTIKAHPTSYRGVNFRSRLEATWAAFFDLANIPWSYEPIDLDGWVPDFVLFGKIAVEVKPVLDVADLPNFQGSIEQMRASITHLALVLVGAEPTHSANRIGWLYSDHDMEFSNLWCADGELTLVPPLLTGPLWAEAKNATQWKPAYA